MLIFHTTITTLRTMRKLTERGTNLQGLIERSTNLEEANLNCILLNKTFMRILHNIDLNRTMSISSKTDQPGYKPQTETTRIRKTLKDVKQDI